MKQHSNLRWAFDGFNKRHMALDERTAPYSVSNFISTMEVDTVHDKDVIVLVAPRTLHPQETYKGPMTDYIAMAYDASTPIGATMATLPDLVLRSPVINHPPPIATNLAASTRLRLHNMSVKLECLGTNTGLYAQGGIYVGRVPMIETGVTSGVPTISLKTAWFDDSVSVGYLKSISACQLLSDPLYVHSCIAENVSYKSWHDITVPATGIDIGSLGVSTSLEPILIYIPRAGTATSHVKYRVSVGQQWCTRHPHDVSMRATQVPHEATEPSFFQRAVTQAAEMGGQALASGGKAALTAGLESFKDAWTTA
jgi:hypothetical protein